METSHLRARVTADTTDSSKIARTPNYYLNLANSRGASSTPKVLDSGDSQDGVGAVVAGLLKPSSVLQEVKISGLSKAEYIPPASKATLREEYMTSEREHYELERAAIRQSYNEQLKTGPRAHQTSWGTWAWNQMTSSNSRNEGNTLSASESHELLVAEELNTAASMEKGVLPSAPTQTERKPVWNCNWRLGIGVGVLLLLLVLGVFFLLKTSPSVPMVQFKLVHDAQGWVWKQVSGSAPSQSVEDLLIDDVLNSVDEHSIP